MMGSVRRVRLAAHRARQREAVHAGHLDVGDQQLRQLGVELAQRVGAVLGQRHAVALPGQQATGLHAHDLGVVGNHHQRLLRAAQGRGGGRRSGGSGSAFPRCVFLGSTFRRGMFQGRAFRRGVFLRGTQCSCALGRRQFGRRARRVRTCGGVAGLGLACCSGLFGSLARCSLAFGLDARLFGTGQGLGAFLRLGAVTRLPFRAVAGFLFGARAGFLLRAVTGFLLGPCACRLFQCGTFAGGFFACGLGRCLLGLRTRRRCGQRGGAVGGQALGIGDRRGGSGFGGRAFGFFGGAPLGRQAQCHRAAFGHGRGVGTPAFHALWRGIEFEVGGAGGRTGVRCGGRRCRNRRRLHRSGFGGGVGRQQRGFLGSLFGVGRAVGRWQHLVERRGLRHLGRRRGRCRPRLAQQHLVRQRLVVGAGGQRRGAQLRRGAALAVAAPAGGPQACADARASRQRPHEASHQGQQHQPQAQVFHAVRTFLAPREHSARR